MKNSDLKVLMLSYQNSSKYLSMKKTNLIMKKTRMRRVRKMLMLRLITALKIMIEHRVLMKKSYHLKMKNRKKSSETNHLLTTKMKLRRNRQHNLLINKIIGPEGILKIAAQSITSIKLVRPVILARLVELARPVKLARTVKLARRVQRKKCMLISKKGVKEM